MNRALWNGKIAIGGLTAMALGLGVVIGTQAQPANSPSTPKIARSPLRSPGDLYQRRTNRGAQAEHACGQGNRRRDDHGEMGGASDNAQIGVSVVLRPKDGENKYYAVHDDVAEVYYVIEGKGTMKLGGTITDWERRPVSIENGEGSRGTTAVGARDVTISKGDMLIIPAGTPHKWESSDQFTYYVVVRADPKGVAPLLQLGKAQFVRPKQ